MAKHAGNDRMSCPSAFVFSEDFTGYHFHSDHPFNQKRVILTYELLRETGFLKDEHILPPRMATDAEINLVHDESYIHAVKKAGEGKLSEAKAAEYGLGTEDTPIFNNMHEASALLVGGTLQAADAVLEGKFKHALNLGGGLHHGFKRKASGFCIYNDGAIVIEYIRKKYGYRVLYVDTDAHHGDGVQWTFYDHSDVCTLSIHETGRYLFPGTGNVNERGQKEGYGYSFNIPIDAFTEDESFLEVYETAMREVTDYFKPDVIVTQNGVDAHYYDPLTHLYGTMKIYEYIPKIAHELAHTYCDGKWIALGGGGYDIWRVVPRAWSQLWKIMSTDTPFSGSLPEAWLNKWKDSSPVPLPETWEDTENMYKPIPRKAEITEKNKQTLDKAMKWIQNQKNRPY